MRPFFGHRRTERLDVEGECRPDGFSLIVTHTGTPLELECGIGDPNNVGTGYSLFSMWLVSALLTYVAIERLGPGLAAPRWRLITVALGAVILYLGIRPLLRMLNTPLAGRQQWRWHACEHKAAIVLESDLAPTEENVRRANPVSLRCGTAQLVTDALSNVALGLWLVHGSWWWCPVFLSTIHAWASIMPRMRGQKKPVRDNDNLFSQIFIAPVLLLTLAIERMLVIRTPTDAQIRATAQLLQAVQQTDPWVQPPRLRSRTRPHP